MPPETEALQDQKRRSRNTMEEWWLNILQRGEILKGKGWTDWVKNEDLQDDYYDFSGKTRDSHPNLPGALGRKIRTMAPSLGSSKQRSGVGGFGKREVGMDVPGVHVLREDWEKTYGPEEWSHIEVEIQGDLSIQAPYNQSPEL